LDNEEEVKQQWQSLMSNVATLIVPSMDIINNEKGSSKRSKYLVSLFHQLRSIGVVL
jgi:hypothetical protein